MTTATAHRPTDGRTTERRKALLFCPTCGFESAIVDGDWLVTERTTADEERVVYECPECLGTVADRPALD